MSDWTDYGLPERPLINGFNRTVQNNILRSNTDTGYAKMRKRFTARTIYYDLQFSFTRTQKDLFLTFFDSVSYMAGGTGLFTISDPDDSGETPGSITVRLNSSKGMPVLIPDGDSTDFLLNISLEKLPE